MTDRTRSRDKHDQARRIRSRQGQHPFEPLVPGDSLQLALNHVQQRFKDALAVIDATLARMGGWGWQALERWATVEQVAQGLIAEGKPVTLSTVKAAISADPAWAPKLRKPAFSDANIVLTLAGVPHGPSQ